MAEILPPPPIGEPFASYQWDDWYRKVRKTINDGQNVAWSSITGKPTTLAGFGITDGLSTSRQINTTLPLTGGGNLSADRTLGVNTFTSSTSGVVPASGGGTSNYLRADGTWASPGAGGGLTPAQILSLVSIRF